MFHKEAPLRIDQLYSKEGISLYIPESVFAANPLTGPHSLRRLRLGSLDDLRLIDDPEMANWPQHTEKYRRLDQFVRFDWGPNNTSVYIVDHHHFALFGWAEAVKEGKIGPGAFLRHFDDHNDAGIAHGLKVMSKRVFGQRKWNLDEVVQYIKVLGCWEFIEPAQRMGLVGNFIHIKPGVSPKVTFDTEHGANLPVTKYTGMSMGYYRSNVSSVSWKEKIVGIDLDYFESADLDPDEEEVDIQAMRQDISSAGVVTLATSPGFINPEKAVRLIKRILA